jgi:hypothetical protein
MFSIQIENFGSISGKRSEKQAFGTPDNATNQNKNRDATDRIFFTKKSEISIPGPLLSPGKPGW